MRRNTEKELKGGEKEKSHQKGRKKFLGTEAQEGVKTRNT